MALRPQQFAKKNTQRKAHRNGRPLDAMAVQTLKRFVQTLIQCGYSADDIARWSNAYAQQSKGPSQQARNHEAVRQDDWVQILTLWSLDPDYVDQEGRPLALRVRGAAPSVEALLKRVHSRLTLKEVCTQLLMTGAARKEKNRLVAIAHAPIVFPVGSPEQSAHHLHLLHSILLNIEHNAAASGGALWVERQSICHDFPQSALAAYSVATSDRAQTFLEREDATMHRIARFTPPNGRTVRATVHILFSAHEAGAPEGTSNSYIKPASPALTTRKPRSRRARAASRPQS